MILASRGSLGTPLGALLGRLGGLLGHLETILGVLGRSLGFSGLSCAVLAASWGPLGPSERGSVVFWLWPREGASARNEA